MDRILEVPHKIGFLAHAKQNRFAGDGLKLRNLLALISARIGLNK